MWGAASEQFLPTVSERVEAGQAVAPHEGEQRCPSRPVEVARAQPERLRRLDHADLDVRVTEPGKLHVAANLPVLRQLECALEDRLDGLAPELIGRDLSMWRADSAGSPRAADPPRVGHATWKPPALQPTEPSGTRPAA